MIMSVQVSRVHCQASARVYLIGRGPGLQSNVMSDM